MANFKYTCKDIHQKIVRGTIEAETLQAAISLLTRKGLYPVKVLSENINTTKQEFSERIKIPVRIVTIFTRQLSDLLSSGISLLKALEIVEQQTTNPHFKKVINLIILSVKDGNSLSSTLNKFPKIFSSFYVNMVKSGEASGTVDKVLDELADTTENEEEIKNQIRSALAYPIFIVIVGVVTTIILMSFVVPKIAGIFIEIDQPLPFITKFLIVLSKFFNKFWWLILLIISSLIFFISRQRQHIEGRSLFERFILSIPIVSGIYRNNQISKFCRTLSAMLHNGVHIVTSLDIVYQIIYSTQFRKEILFFTSGIKKGRRLEDTLKESKFLPLSTKNIISVGEASGQLEKALKKAGNIHEKAMNRTIKLATSLLEPVLILIIGVVVGFVVLAMLWPIFQINIFIK